MALSCASASTRGSASSGTDSITWNYAVNSAFIADGGSSRSRRDRSRRAITTVAAACVATTGVTTTTSITAIVVVFLFFKTAIVSRVDVDNAIFIGSTGQAKRCENRRGNEGEVEALTNTQFDGATVVEDEGAAIEYANDQAVRCYECLVICAANTDGGEGGFDVIRISGNTAGNSAETAL